MKKNIDQKEIDRITRDATEKAYEMFNHLRAELEAAGLAPSKAEALARKIIKHAI